MIDTTLMLTSIEERKERAWELLKKNKINSTLLNDIRNNTPKRVSTLNNIASAFDQDIEIVFIDKTTGETYLQPDSFLQKISAEEIDQYKKQMRMLAKRLNELLKRTCPSD